MTFAIETTRLGQRYGRIWALRDCSLALPEGAVVALVGPNGAGKSTLLNIISGLLHPSEGAVRVFGSPMADEPSMLAQIAFMAQDTGLYPMFTARDLLAFGSRLNPAWDDRWASCRVHALGIPDRVAAARLSGGQRAQLALVLALAKRPRLLLLDEPLASLDPVARHEVMALLMERLADGGLTVLLSSHIITDLVDTCDWLVAINRGRVQISGSIDELIATHKLLTGPRAALDALPSRLPVISRTVTERQAIVLARLTDEPADPQWTTREASLEELVLGYLRQPDATALSGPITARP
ncbi:ABC transporter ATP-binding protein [Micromonosporaceae bacterium B7E4]